MGKTNKNWYHENLIGEKINRLTVEKLVLPIINSRVYYICQCDCGNIVKVRKDALTNKTRMSCGCFQKEKAGEICKARVGELSTRWNGGRTINSNGYVEIYKPDHPAAHFHSSHVLEHRLVMEQSLGRFLYKDETVHHKNGIKDDNRIENLQLMCGFHPQGQKTVDLVAWAKEILKRYENFVE